MAKKSVNLVESAVYDGKLPNLRGISDETIRRNLNSIKDNSMIVNAINKVSTQNRVISSKVRTISEIANFCLGVGTGILIGVGISTSFATNVDPKTAYITSGVLGLSIILKILSACVGTTAKNNRRFITQGNEVIEERSKVKTLS